jgi:hypothetical protein
MERFKESPFIRRELEETLEAHALFIVDPYDRTVNKGNTVLRGRETALMDKMLETLHLLRDTGKLIK